MKTNNPTDPGAEMKVRASARVTELTEKEGYCCGDVVNIYEYELEEELAAFAAKEVARAVEEERMANCKAICNRCEDASLAYPAKLIDGRWTHAYTASTVTAPCLAHPIHERSQVKGEGS